MNSFKMLTAVSNSCATLNFRAPLIFAHLARAKIRGRNFRAPRCAKIKGVAYKYRKYDGNVSFNKKNGGARKLKGAKIRKILRCAKIRGAKIGGAKIRGARKFKGIRYTEYYSCKKFVLKSPKERRNLLMNTLSSKNFAR